MSLEKNDIAEIVRRCREAPGDATIAALAQEYATKASTIEWHLKRANTNDGFETDADLGIGEDDAPAPIDIAALIAHPQFAKLVDAAVAARGANNGSASAQSADFSALTATLQRMFEVQSQQQPGYVKPLSVEEMDRRANGYVQMHALLKDYQAKGVAPRYLLTEMFFECTNAITFSEGTEIRTYLPPAESFKPQNDAAENVYAAMLQWIGGETPHIGDQLEAAIIASHGGVPLVGSSINMAPRANLVEAVDSPKVDVSRKRSAGTIVPERRDVSTAERLAGPTLVGDFAA